MMSQRVKQLRRARGLSLDALAAEMGGVVTKQALAKYENGSAQPSPIVLNRLAAALGVKAAHLWSEPNIHVEFIAYRKGSGLLVRDQAMVESMVSVALEDRVRLQELTDQDNGRDVLVRAFEVRTLDDAERAADTLRARWSLGTDPIASVVDTLEEHHVHVLEIDASERFDGIAAVARDSDDHIAAAAVVTRRGVPGERQRLNLTHELGHLVLQPTNSVDVEKAAFRFGSAFLAPADTLRRSVGIRRDVLQAPELLMLKQRFGMSMQALLYRLKELGVINAAYFRAWCINVNRLGWKKQEPMALPPEQPQWLRKTALRAVGEGVLGDEEATRLLGQTTDETVPRSLVGRRAFMKLPLEERRRLLAEQAEAAAQHYEQDTEWRELLAGDILEY